MSSTADYIGRTYDVLAFPGNQPSGDILLAQDLLAGGGSICTGVVKLAQRFVLEFLTEKGSMPFMPDRGCDFMTLLESGELRSDFDVQDAFTFAVVDIVRNLRAEEADTDPDDERFADATLEGLEVSPGIAILRIRLTSLAGTARPIILPVKTAY